jgi:hypothetical protein
VPDVLSTVVEAPELPDYNKIFGNAAQGVLAGSQQLSAAKQILLDRQRAFNTDMGS